ncbi:MAG: hypothetical protein ACTSO2_05755 [Promethearchaeota archaeon]
MQNPLELAEMGVCFTFEGIVIRRSLYLSYVILLYVFRHESYYPVKLVKLSYATN